MHSTREFLGTLPHLSSIDSRGLDDLHARFREVTYHPRQGIQAQAAASAGLHVLIAGWVKLFRTSSDGKELLMALAGPGDLFGPCCAPFSGDRSLCSAQAQTPVRALLMSHQTWKLTVGQDLALAGPMLATLSGNRRDCTELAPLLAFHGVESRLARFLLSLTRWCTPGAPEQEIPRVLSQGEMASAIGTAREVVTRLLGGLEARNLIDRRGRRIIVKDPRGLAKLAG
ncbi:MAG: Crp/Fnr family transcriptional regulator [Candidatus Riflebacteria bacterium]|nr:Crp/Fnr family transcriptional regulator [Candidatus Riflebacteria bacterium]